MTNVAGYLSSLMGLAAGTKLPKLNAMLRLAAVHESEIAAIRALNWVDVELYELAKVRWARIREQAPPKSIW